MSTYNFAKKVAQRLTVDDFEKAIACSRAAENATQIVRNHPVTYDQSWWAGQHPCGTSCCVGGMMVLNSLTEEELKEVETGDFNDNLANLTRDVVNALKGITFQYDDTALDQRYPHRVISAMMSSSTDLDDFEESIAAFKEKGNLDNDECYYDNSNEDSWYGDDSWDEDDSWDDEEE